MLWGGLVCSPSHVFLNSFLFHTFLNLYIILVGFFCLSHLWIPVLYPFRAFYWQALPPILPSTAPCLPGPLTTVLLAVPSISSFFRSCSSLTSLPAVQCYCAVTLTSIWVCIILHCNYLNMWSSCNLLIESLQFLVPMVTVNTGHRMGVGTEEIFAG